MICITDERIPVAALRGLDRLGVEVYKLRPYDRLAPEVASHTDLLLHFARDRVITYRGYFEQERELFACLAALGYKVVTSERVPQGRYPYDVGLCAARTDKYIICNPSVTDPAVLDAAEEDGLARVGVRQGYTRCSTCLLPDGSAITSDRGIFHSAKSRLSSCLLISPGSVELPGYDYGFIGGASGICGAKLVFCGSIERHPEYDRIKAFSDMTETELVSLSDEPLYDVGGLMFLDRI